MSNVQPIPDGYHTVTPYLVMDSAADAIEFYKKAFGASEVMRLPMPGDKIGHAELQIGTSRIMLADECPEQEFVGPHTIGGTPVSIMLYVEDVDAVFNRAVEAGASIVKPLQDQFYGDRMGTVKDPFGHIWSVGTHIEDVAPDELQRRMEQMMVQQAQ